MTNESGTTESGRVEHKPALNIRGVFALAALTLTVAVGATFVQSRSGSPVAIAEVRGGEVKALRVSDGHEDLEEARPFWTAQTDRILRASDGTLTEDSFIAVDGDLYFLTTTASGKRLHRTSLGNSSSDVVFEADTGSFKASFDERSETFFISASDEDNRSCFRVRDGRQQRLGRGSCTLTARGEVLFADEQHDYVELTWKTADLELLDSTRIYTEFRTLIDVSQDGLLIHAKDSNGDDIFLSRSGRIVWSRPQESLSVNVLAAASSLQGVAIGIDLTREESRVDVITTATGTPQVESFMTGEGADFALVGDGSSVVYRETDYLGEPGRRPWKYVNADEPDTAPTVIYRGDLEFVAGPIDGHLFGWDSETGVLVAGPSTGTLTDVYDTEGNVRALNLPAGPIFHIGDELLKYDAETVSVSRIADHVSYVRQALGQTESVVVYRSTLGEDVLATIDADGTVTELHRDDEIIGAQVIDGSVWFTADRTASDIVRVFRVPLDGSTGAVTVAEESVLLPQAMVIPSKNLTSHPEWFGVHVDEERRRCLAEGIPVLEEGDSFTFTAIPEDGDQFCVYIPRTRDGDSVDLDISTVSDHDLWFELRAGNSVVAQVDDLVDEDGEVVDVNPWLLGHEFEQATYRVSVFPFDDEVEGDTVKVRVNAAGQARPEGELSATDYVEEDRVDSCTVLVDAGKPETLNLESGETVVCVTPDRDQATYVSFFKDLSVESATATLNVDCGSESSKMTGSGGRTFEVSNGKRVKACSVSTSKQVDIEVLVGPDADQADGRAPLLLGNQAPCDNGYTTDNVAPISRCSKGMTVLTAQRALKRLGYDVQPDGFHGPESVAAMAAFQLDAGLNGSSPDGDLTATTWNRLFPDFDHLGVCSERGYAEPGYVEFGFRLDDAIDRRPVVCTDEAGNIEGWMEAFTYFDGGDGRVTLRFYDSDLREIRDRYYDCEYGPCVWADFSGDELFYITMEDRFRSVTQGFLIFRD